MSLIFIIISAVVLLFGFVVAFGAPYVPSLGKEVRNAFKELYPLSKNDTIVDLGSGDGSVLLAASRSKAHCVGIELNPALVMISRLRLGKRADIRLGNMWLTELPPQTTLVYAFVVSRDTKRLKKYMQAEANRLKKDITLMTFGAMLPNVEPLKICKAHSLYVFRPLQAD